MKGWGSIGAQALALGFGSRSLRVYSVCRQGFRTLSLSLLS